MPPITEFSILVGHPNVNIKFSPLGRLIKSVWEEYQVWKRGKVLSKVCSGREYGKGKGKKHHLPLNIKAVGKNIRWGKRGRGNENLEQKIKIKKMKVEKNIKLLGTIYTPGPGMEIHLSGSNKIE